MCLFLKDSLRLFFVAVIWHMLNDMISATMISRDSHYYKRIASKRSDRHITGKQHFRNIPSSKRKTSGYATFKRPFTRWKHATRSGTDSRSNAKSIKTAYSTKVRFFHPVLNTVHPYGIIGEGNFHPALVGTNIYDNLKIPLFRQDVQLGSQPIPVIRRFWEPDHGFRLPPDIDMHEDHPFDNELPLPAEEPVQMTIQRDKEQLLKYIDPDREDPMMNFLWNQGAHHKRNKHIRGYEDKQNDVDEHGKVRNSLHGYHTNNNWKSGDTDAKSYHGGIFSYANNAYTSMQAYDAMEDSEEKSESEKRNNNPFLDETLVTSNEIWREIAQANKGYHRPGHPQGEKEAFDDSLVGQGVSPLHDGKIVHNTNSQNQHDPPFSWMPESVEDLSPDGDNKFY